MFDKMLSKIGIGAAKVDTVLHNAEVMRGEVLTGEVRLQGGKTSQVINRIYVELQTNFIQEHDEGSSSHVFSLHLLEIADRFTLEANEEVIYDFELQVPLDSPLSFGHTHSWLKTGLDVSFAFDPKDHDPVVILPDPASQMVLAAAEDLGFQHTHHSGRCLALHSWGEVPFVQVFEYRGTGAIGRQFEELEIMAQADEHQSHFQIEVDRRNHGLMGWIRDGMDLDETRLRFSVPHDAHFGVHEFEQVLSRARH